MTIQQKTNPKKKVNTSKDLARTAEWQKNNKDRVKEISAKYRKSEKYPITYLNKTLKAQYGITYNDYLEILESQNGVCKICQNPENNAVKGARWGKSHKPLAVDHCHKTNKVRGLLCFTCNTGLGLYKDSIELLTRAISYLKENES